MAEAARRAGSRLACYAGCGTCCSEPFPVNLLDAARLARGMRGLREAGSERARRITERARQTVARFAPEFPGNHTTGELGNDRFARAAFFERFDGTPCPALCPDTGVCEIHEHRPVACRIAGPPIRRGGEDMPHCRLCYEGEPPEVIEAARVEVDPENFELSLLAECGLQQTLIAYALLRED